MSKTSHTLHHAQNLFAAAKQCTGDDLAKAVPKFDKERLPDAHGLVDIESSFSRLVGNKFKAILDLKFLKIVVHVVFGECLCGCPNVHHRSPLTKAPS